MSSSDDDRKRKRHSFGGSSATTSADHTAQQNQQAQTKHRTDHQAEQRHLGDQHPQQASAVGNSSSSGVRRSRLQRGAKDKVYAERLAAAGDNVHGFIGGELRGDEVGASAAATINDGIVDGKFDAMPREGSAKQLSTSRGNMTSTNKSANNQKPTNAAKHQHNLQRPKKRGREKMEKCPPGWPFTDTKSNRSGKKSTSSSKKSTSENSTVGVGAASGNSSKRAKQCDKQSFGGSTGRISVGNNQRWSKEVVQESMLEDLPVLTRKQQAQLAGAGGSTTVQHDNNALESSTEIGKSTTSFSKTVKNGKESGRSRGRALSSPPKAPVETKLNQLSQLECQQSLVGSKTAASDPLQVAVKPSNNSSLRHNYSKATNWTCHRCTLVNSNRRKKCQVCGNIRHLSLSSDGLLTLNDCGGGGDVAVDGAIAIESSRTIKEVGGNEQIEIQHAGNGWNDNVLSQMSDVMQSQSNNSIDMSVMISEPLSTRSRSKQIRLTQGQTQPEEEQHTTMKYSHTYSDRSQQSEMSAMIDATVVDRTTCNQTLGAEAEEANQDQCEMEQPKEEATMGEPEKQLEERTMEIPEQQQRESNQLDNTRDEQPTPNDANETSDFRQWIKKRRNARREKRREKQATKNSISSTVEVKNVRVRVVVAGGSVGLNSAARADELVAIVRSAFFQRELDETSGTKDAGLENLPVEKNCGSLEPFVPESTRTASAGHFSAGRDDKTNTPTVASPITSDAIKYTDDKLSEADGLVKIRVSANGEVVDGVCLWASLVNHSLGSASAIQAISTDKAKNNRETGIVSSGESISAEAEDCAKVSEDVANVPVKSEALVNHIFNELGGKLPEELTPINNENDKENVSFQLVAINDNIASRQSTPEKKVSMQPNDADNECRIDNPSLVQASSGVITISRANTSTPACHERIDSSFVPMTQQMPAFDYFSQASFSSAGNNSHDEKIIAQLRIATPHVDVSWPSGAAAERSFREDRVVTNSNKSFSTRTNSSSVVAVDPLKADSEVNQQMDQSLTTMPRVQPAESDEAITLAREQTKNATKLADQIETTTDHAVNVELVAALEERQSRSSFQDEPSVLSGFSFGGNGTSIALSKEQILRAERLLNDSPNDTGQPSVTEQGSQDETATATAMDGVQLAGSGKSIALSNEQLAVTSRLLDGNTNAVNIISTAGEEVTANSSYEEANMQPAIMMGFQLAGSGKSIALTDEQMMRASHLFEGNATDQTFPAEKHTSPCRDEPTIASVMHGFQLAGSGKPISLSEEQLVNAASLIGGSPRKPESLYPTTTRTQTVGCGKSLTPSEEQLVSATSLLNDIPKPTETLSTVEKHQSEPVISFAASGLSFAGSGKSITLSDDQLANTSRLLDGNTNTAARSTAIEEHQYRHSIHDELAISSTTLGFSFAGSGKSIDLSEEQLSKASQLLSYSKDEKVSTAVCKPPPALPSTSMMGFAFAGSGKSIALSEEELANASRILDDKPKPASGTTANEDYQSKNSLQGLLAPSAVLGFSFAGSGKTIALSDEQLTKASQLLYDTPKIALTTTETSCQDQSATLSVGFSFARSGKSISLSEEQLSMAEQLLGGSKPEGNTALALSTTAGSTRSVAVSDESIVMFQTASGKSAISVSEDSMRKVNNLFGDNQHLHDDDARSMMEVTDESLANTSHLFGTQEESTKHLHRGTIPAVDTSFEDASIPKQSTESSVRRGRNKQRVRFSLDGVQTKLIEPSTNTELDTADPASIEGDQFTSGFAFAGSRQAIALSKGDLENAGRYLEGNADANEKLITPDKRQYHYSVQVDVDNRLVDACNTNDLSYAGRQGNATTGSIVTETKQSTEPSNSYDSEPSHETVFNLPPTSPHLSSIMYTPLHAMGNANEPLRSEIKSKRLFGNAREKNDKSDTDGSPETRQFTKQWSFISDSLDCPKISLRDLAEVHGAIENSWNVCTECGVKDVTLRVTSINATKLRFRIDDGMPLFILGQRDVPKCNHVGKIADIKAWLVEQGCDDSLFSDKWIGNHYRWIVWKLAAMERRFPHHLGGHYLTYERVLKQMKGRYDKELRNFRRPAVRKMLNRDVAASLPVILCVSQILRFKSRPPKGSSSDEIKEEVRLELTDGWYSLPAVVDAILLKFVEESRIAVGSKLMICNGQLVGSDDGVEPLDDSYSSSKRDCPLLLGISANNSRLARWDATLGFVRRNNSNLYGGNLLVKSLQDIFIGGGTVPAIDLVVCKKYPRMFLEQLNGGASIHLTEAEEAARQSEYDSRHQRASERYADDATKECSEVSSLLFTFFTMKPLPLLWYNLVTDSSFGVHDSHRKSMRMLLLSGKR